MGLVANDPSCRGRNSQPEENEVPREAPRSTHRKGGISRALLMILVGPPGCVCRWLALQ